jgi:RND family efflux transporter MFP subunit
MARGYMTASVFSFLLFSAGCSSSRNTELTHETASPSTKVRAAKVKLQEGKQTYRLSGTVRSVATAPLSSKIMGTVLEIRAHAGDRIEVGQLLAVVDSRDAEAMVQKSEAGKQEAQMALREIEKSLEAARSNLRLASSTLKRYELLAAQKSVSPQEFDEVQTRQRSAEASLEALDARRQQVTYKIQQAESDVNSSEALRSYAQIRSPFNGIVTQRLAEPGSLAVPGMPLLIVEETDRYRLEVPIQESRVSQIKSGQKVLIRIEALGLENSRASVSEIQPAADAASRTYLAKIDLPPHSQLRSGMYGEAFVEGRARQGIWISPESVVRHGQLEGVYVIEKGNILRLRLIKLGETTPLGLEVLSGLEGGETYVSRNIQRLQEGDRVEILNQSSDGSLEASQ